jgi:NAD(P)-dependent dehydrogenase (short-subunit alcohol dehydrogenase family)
MDAIFRVFSNRNTPTSDAIKNILITGASSGIGRSLALQYASKGANLAVLARREGALRELCQECIDHGASRAIYYCCDLTKNADIEAATAKAIADFGSFDMIILNAGRSQGHYFEEIKDVEQIDYLLKLNVNGVINTCHYLLPYVQKTAAARIVIVSSVAGLIPVPMRTVYCASKFALTGFANTLRMELLDTYGKNAPALCLINFPEVRGTELNDSPLDFGADTPPFCFDTSRALDVDVACSAMIRQVARGTREWGHPLQVTLFRPLYSVVPSLFEAMIMKHVKKTHYRKAKED